MTYVNGISIAAIAGLLATGAVAGEFGKAGPGTTEPMISTPVQQAAPARFTWTGGYAGVGVGYGRMDVSGFDSQSSGVAGLFGGYRMDMGGFVVGGEANLMPATLGTATLPGGDELKWGGSLMGTAGMPFGAEGRTLGYVGAGPAFVRTSGAGGSENSVGGTVALGVDHMITDQIMVRGGVNYTVINNVGNTNLNTRTLGAGVGLGFKF